MGNTYIVLDCDYLCHRAKYALGGLSYKEDVTDVIFGFLKDLDVFKKRFKSSNFIFCFDSKTSLRKEIYPKYKANRKKYKEDLTKEEENVEKEFKRQVQRLRRRYLPLLGFRNILVQPGYEADDMIAQVCWYLPMKDNAIIISADQDLFQLVNQNVSVYDPRKQLLTTANRIKKIMGIGSRADFIDVKCITGCSTDNVKGIKGVGVVNATKYVNRQLSQDSKMYKKIVSLKGIKRAKRNLGLIGLPFKGAKPFVLKRDEPSAKGWREVCKQLGMKSIKTKMPF